MPRNRDRDQTRNELSELINESVRERVRRQITGGHELPDGVVTIVFTDVEGSTGLVRELGDREARDVLRRHDDLVREVLKEHDGIEVERSGDAFMLAFRLPSRAIGFALALHDRLAGEGDLRVRIGMDTGEVIKEEKGYFGQTVFRAARIAELGRGGQILASESTRMLAEPRADARFVDLGERELAGLGTNHRVVEVLPPGSGGE